MIYLLGIWFIPGFRNKEPQKTPLKVALRKTDVVKPFAKHVILHLKNKNFRCFQNQK